LVMMSPAAFRSPKPNYKGAARCAGNQQTCCRPRTLSHRRGCRQTDLPIPDDERVAANLTLDHNGTLITPRGLAPEPRRGSRDGGVIIDAGHAMRPVLLRHLMVRAD